MQGVLTSREAWVRFATNLYIETDLTPNQVAKEADQMLIEYLKRFPDPKEQQSAQVVQEGRDDVLEFFEEAPSISELVSGGLE